MKTIKKINKEEEIQSLSLYDLDGEIDNTIKTLQSIKDRNQNCIKIYLDHDYEIDYDGTRRYYFTVTGERLETNEEFNERKEILEKQRLAEKERKRAEKLAKEEKERKEFERLKAKFEK